MHVKGVECMKERMKDFFWIPDNIDSLFWQQAVHKNRLSIRVVCVLILIFQLYNMSRVLFFSRSALSTLNNRIYFGLYLFLFCASILYLILDHLFAAHSIKKQWYLQLSAVVICLIWNICINTYDFTQTPPVSTYPFMSVVLGSAMLITMPNLMFLLLFVSGYIIFVGLNFQAIDSGNLLNLTIMMIIAIIIAFININHMMVEISQRKEIVHINAQLQQLLQKDALTELLNKKAAEEYIAAFLKQSSYNRYLAMMIVDLDDFKHINDEYGHPCGDHVLAEASRSMRIIFDTAICIGRIGGDEFVLLLDDIKDLKMLEKLCSELNRELKKISWNGKSLNISCSIGIVSVSENEITYDHLYEEVDQMLYEAKRFGKGCCSIKKLS